MTETYSAPTPDQIEDEDLTPSVELSRQADEILAEGEARSFDHVTSVRQAMREDASAARDWGRHRLAATRQAITDEPVKASLYALGIGVVIGLLAAR